jgi:hypothetical protein
VKHHAGTRGESLAAGFNPRESSKAAAFIAAVDPPEDFNAGVNSLFDFPVLSSYIIISDLETLTKPQVG